MRGGPSVEYDISMQTGAGVINALLDAGFTVKDIIVSKTGQWLCNGFVKTPEQSLVDTDVVFIALHGAYGEDGTVQRILERHAIAYTGSKSFASAIAMNKVLTKDFLKEKTDRIKMAPHLKLTKSGVSHIGKIAQSIRELFGPDYIIKPVSGGSSIGTMMTNASSLESALKNALEQNEEIVVEQRIFGKEATVGILEGFRDQTFYQLPVIEIVPPAHASYFSADVKYTGQTEEICPGRFSDEERDELLEIAKMVHQLLELRQYSRSDFIVADDGVYFLEVNTLPGLTPHSLFPKAMEAVGSSYKDLVTHLVSTA